MSDGAFSAGSAHLAIKPRLSARFNEELRAQLRKVNVTHDVKVGVTPDFKGFQQKLDATVKGLNAPTVKVKLEPNLAGFQTRLNAAVKGINAPTIKVTATPVLAKGFKADLKSKIEKASGTQKIALSPKLSDDFKTKLQAAVKSATKNPQKVAFDPKLAAGFRSNLKSLVEAASKNITVDVSPKLKGIGAFKTDLKNRLKTGNMNAEVGVKLDFTQAHAQLATFRAQVAATPLALNVNMDTSAAVAQLMALRTLAGSIDVNLGSAGAGGGRSGSGGSRDRGGMIRRIRVQMEVDRASVARAESELAQATSRMQGLYRQQGDAADRVALAQQRLNEVNSRANATASQRLSASQALARAQRDLADRQADVARGVGRQADAHRRLTQAQNDQNSITRLMKAGLAGLASTVGQMAGKLFSAVSPAALLKVALIGLAAVSLIPLLGQLTQALGVISLLPAMGAAAAASLATVVIGGWGIADAFSAAGESAKDTGKEAEKSAKAQRNAARQVEDAERSVGDARENAAQTAKDGARQIQQAERQVQDAQKRSKQAQEDLTRARKDALEQIEDLNLALKGSAIDEEDALIAVERAKERLRELGKDGEPVTLLDVREAQNNVRGAIQRLDEVRERNKDLRDETIEANKAGVEGSQQVVAAKEAVADATQAEQDAQDNLQVTHENVSRANAQAQRQIEDALRRVADAQEAQAEALETTAGSVDKFAEAMANLSPNAQDFVTKVRELGGAWSDLRMAVQDSLFAGMGDKMQELGNTYIPILTGGLSGLADVLNGRLKSAMDWLNSTGTTNDITTILENTKEALGPLIDGLGNVGRALFDIAVVGSDLLPEITGAFEEGTGSFADTIAEMRQDGRLEEYMRNAMDAFAQIWRIIKNIGSAVSGLFTGSEETGDSWLQSIEDATKKWADFFDDPKNMEKVEQFFEDVKETVDSIVDALRIAADLIKLLPHADTRTEEEKLEDREERIQDVKENGGWLDRTKDWIGGGAFDGIERKPGQSPFSALWDKWFGDDEPAANAGTSGGSFLAPEGGTPFNGGNLQSDLQNQLNTGNVQGGGFLGALGDPEVWGEKWTSFSDTVSTGWNEKVWPSLQGVKDKAVEIGQGFVDDVQTKAGNAWTGLKDGVSSGWTSIQGTWDTLKTQGLGGLANEFTSKITNGAVTSWKDLPSAIMSGVGDIVNTHFPGLSNGLNTLQGWFQTGVEAIGNLWDGLKAKLATPINFVIREVYNNGIKRFWDSIGPKIGLPELPPINEIPAFATGGTVDGVMSGYSPGVDDRIIAVGGGEAVMRPEWTRAVGKDFVDQANHIARNQGVDGVRKFMGGFSNGGVVESIVKLVNENFPMMDITSTHRSTNDLHGQGKAVDFSNGYDTTPEMQDAARFFHDNYGSRLAELIHYPLNGWQNIDEGQPFNFGEPTNSQHRNHVHVAAHEPLIPMTEEEKGLFAKIAGAVGGAISRVSNVFRNMAADLFEKPLNGLGALIPDQFEGIGEFGRIPKALYNTMKDKLINFVRGKATEKDGSEGGNTQFDVSAGAEQWRDTVLKALEMTGHDASEADIVLKQIQIESGGNPNAINDWDINAQNGTPSKGLIQTIDPTFQAYRDSSLPDSPYDPLANLVAGIRYADATYGDIKNIWPKTMGYDAGGILPDDAMAFNTSGKPEAVFTHDEWKMLERFADLIGRPDFIDQLAAITGGPAEMPKDPAIMANGAADPGPGNYGTGTGTAAAGGYTVPGEGVAAGLASFDKIHGKPGAASNTGTTSGQPVDHLANAKNVVTQSLSSYGQKLPGIAKTFLGGWIPEELLNPGGLVGGLLSAGEELFNWYRNQATGGGAAAASPLGGFDPGSVISGFLGGGTTPAPAPAYQAAPLPAVDQFVKNAPAPAAAGVGGAGDIYNFHVTNIDDAFRKFQQVQSRKTAGFMPR